MTKRRRKRSVGRPQPSGPYLRFGWLIASGGASCRWTASSNGGRSKAEGQTAVCHRHAGRQSFRYWRVNWRDPSSGEWVRTFAIITTDANELVAEIHDRMPLILAPADYSRWLSDEPDLAVPGGADADVAHLDKGQRA